MNKKNITSGAATSATVNINRIVCSPAQFFDKAAAASNSNSCNCNDNFQYMEIADTVAENKNLSSAEFNFSKISNVRFENCDFSRSEFKGTELNNVSFVNCKMESVYFNFAKLNGISFTNCFLDSSEFDFTSGTAVFSGCSVKNAEFPMSSLEFTFIKCNLTRAELNGINNMKLHAEESDFSKAEINDCSITGNAEKCVFVYTEFYGTNGKMLNFTNCKLRSIYTEGAVGIEEETGAAESDENIDNELEKIFE